MGEASGNGDRQQALVHMFEASEIMLEIVKRIDEAGARYALDFLCDRTVEMSKAMLLVKGALRRR